MTWSRAGGNIGVGSLLHDGATVVCHRSFRASAVVRVVYGLGLEVGQTADVRCQKRLVVVAVPAKSGFQGRLPTVEVWCGWWRALGVATSRARPLSPLSMVLVGPGLERR